MNAEVTLQNKGTEKIKYCYAHKLEKEFGETYLNHYIHLVNFPYLLYFTLCPRCCRHGCLFIDRSLSSGGSTLSMTFNQKKKMDL